MKIAGFNISDRLNIDSKALKEGMTIKARVVEVSGSNVTILLENGKLIDAKRLINMEGLKGQLASFFVKSIEDGKLVLSPVNREDFNSTVNRDIDSDKAVEAFISKVLAVNNLENNEENTLLIKAAVNNKLPLTKEDIETLVKTLDKLEGLIHIEKGERIFAVKADKSPTAESIMKLLKVKPGIKPDIIEHGRLETSNQVGNTSEAQETSSVGIDNAHLQEDMELVDVTEAVYSKLKAIFPRDVSKQSLINRIVILTRLGMEVSLDNIEKISNLINKGEGIAKPLLNLLEFIKENKRGIASPLQDFELIRLDGENQISKEAIEEFFRQLRDALEQLPSYIKSSKDLSRELDIRLNKFLDSLDLYSRMNTYYTFIHIPLKFNEEKENSSLIIVKKKNRQHKNSYSAYISLNTKNLKQVDVYCSISDREFKADFIVDREFKDYLRKRFYILKKRLNSLGLNNVIINIKEDEKPDVLNLFMENDLPSSYNLNIRV